MTRCARASTGVFNTEMVYVQMITLKYRNTISLFFRYHMPTAVMFYYVKSIFIYKDVTDLQFQISCKSSRFVLQSKDLGRRVVFGKLVPFWCNTSV